MADGSKIGWTDATWNPVIGCTKVSPGCDHCYAIRTAHRMQANPNPKVSAAYAGTEEGGEWTGRVNLLGDRIYQPLRWRTPRRIFVNAQSDLFHDRVPDDFIACVWAVMALAPHHTFQILTKRHGRMRSLLRVGRFQGMVQDAMVSLAWGGAVKGPAADVVRSRISAWLPLDNAWPLPNVWMGVSVEDQQRADLRIPALLDTPAAVRFLSCEPLLGPIDLTHMDVEGRMDGGYWINALTGRNKDMGRPCRDVAHVDWVIVGGESGPDARPMHPDWPRSLRDQCADAGVAFHFKQWGEWAPAGYTLATHLIQTTTGQHVTRESATVRDPYGHGTGPQDLVDRGHAGWARISRPGKRAAGRLLDGRTHDDYPDCAS